MGLLDALGIQHAHVVGSKLALIVFFIFKLILFKLTTS